MACAFAIFSMLSLILYKYTEKVKHKKELMHATSIGAQDLATPVTSLPHATDTVRAGFPSPADDYIEAELDLISHLVHHFCNAQRSAPLGDSSHVSKTSLFQPRCLRFQLPIVISACTAWTIPRETATAVSVLVLVLVIFIGPSISNRIPIYPKTTKARL